MATIYQAGYVFKDDGTAVSGATVQLYQADTTTTVGSSSTTNSSGYWSLSTTTEHTSGYDVKITSGSSIRYRRGNDKLQLEELDIRNDTGATQGGLFVANTTNSAANKVATFAGRNTTNADNDEIYITFEIHNDADEITEYARMTAVATDVSNGSEDGEIQFDVMKAGTLTKVWTITSSTAGAASMDMDIDSFTIGTGTAATDITLTFDAESADGVITWMEDEDYFKFSDEILMNSTEKILFGDTGTFIHQSSDGVLTITSDTTVDINGAVVFDGAITGATNITLSGELDAATLDISGNADIDGTLEADAITINGTAIGSIYGVIAGSSSIVTTGALDSGSITSGFGNINTGSSTITTTGAVATGALTTGTDGSGVDVIFYSGTSGDNLTWDASEEKLVITGTNGTTSLEIADGNVSIADNLTVSGILTVSGTTTTVDTTNLAVTDPLIKLNQGQTASPANDLGLIFTRGNGSSTNIANRAILWDESADVFVFANTNSEDGETVGNVTIDDYASIHVGALTADDASTFSGGISDAGTIAAGTWNGTAIAHGYIADDIVSGQSEITSGFAAADELMYSDGGTIKRVGLDTMATKLFSVATAGTVAQASDHMLFLDGGATGDVIVESIDDFLTAIAGSNISVSSSQLTASAGGTSIGTSVALRMFIN